LVQFFGKVNGTEFFNEPEQGLYQVSLNTVTFNTDQYHHLWIIN